MWKEDGKFVGVLTVPERGGAIVLSGVELVRPEARTPRPSTASAPKTSAPCRESQRAQAGPAWLCRDGAAHRKAGVRPHVFTPKRRCGFAMRLLAVHPDPADRCHAGYAQPENFAWQWPFPSGMRQSDDFRRALHVKITNALATAAAVAAAGSVGIIGAPIASADDATTTTIGSQAKLCGRQRRSGLDHHRPEDQHGPDPLPRGRHAVGGDGHRRSHPGRRHADRVEPQRTGEERPDLPGSLRRGHAAGRQPGHSRSGREDHRQGVFRRHGRHAGQRRIQRRRPGSFVWLQAPPATQAITPYSPAPARGHTSPVRRRLLRPVPTRAASRAAPGAPLPTGSSGTPLPTGSSGTPLPAGSAGTPAAAGTEGAPLPARFRRRSRAPPAGSQGTAASPTTTTMCRCLPLPESSGVA